MPTVALSQPPALLELPLTLSPCQPWGARLLLRVPTAPRCVRVRGGGVLAVGYGRGGCGTRRVLMGCVLPPGLSRGPSPVVLGSQDALPVATAFTEYVHAYFKGRDADR